MRKLLVLSAVGGLVACVGGRNAPPAEVYDFGLSPPPTAAGVPWTGVALEVRAPPWVNTPAVEYRLLYDTPLRLRAYAGSRWAGEPAQLLAQRLRQQLGITAGGSHAPARCLLRVELQEFSQLFDSPQGSHGTLRGTLEVFDASQRRLATQPFDIATPAATADARGGVAALVTSSKELGREIAAWLNDQEKHGRLTGCRTAAVADQ
ncbi:MAG TPA: ABC-type transport auxiliary lipoprotein family protein [Accumulibacter sp.]|jgi:ABC-type uncharacterized transport system auxiliary subunit|nr:ABC-type transport auxiliary lipoprotein family protein [Accumulibacter sp.]HQC78951.1 ABC-type transport auxiliary lipoprotein family protein [Accumulibacter sp.]